MFKINNSEIVFRRNPKFFSSFWDLMKNFTIMFSPRGKHIRTVIIVILFSLILITMPFFFMDSPDQLVFYILLLSVALFIIPTIFIMTYLVMLKLNPVFRVVGLRFIKGQDGFWIINKDNQEEFISHNNIESINYQPYIVGRMANIFLSNILFYSFYFSKHFLIYYQSNGEEEKEIRIPLNVNKVYEALDLIIGRIPETKRGNVRMMEGKVTASLPGKSPLGIDLDTLRGKIILTLLFLIVIGIWLFMTFYLQGK